MKSFGLLAALGLALAVGLETVAQAQMFGARSAGTGRPSARAGADTSNVGTIQGNERFIRGNRDRGDFVGNSRDSRGFVGMEQATTTTRVRPATADLRIERAPDANRNAPRPSRRDQMYEPRLAVGFRHGSRESEQLSSALHQRLVSSDSIAWLSGLEVSVEGQTATLRGEVASEHARRLAELLVLFEPGIAAVQNELQVRQPSQPALPAPQSPTSVAGPSR